MIRGRARRRRAWLALAAWTLLILLSRWWGPASGPRKPASELAVLEQLVQLLEQENQGLRQRLQLPAALPDEMLAGFEPVPTSLLAVPLLGGIAGDLTPGRRSALIDCGRDLGIEPGFGVVAPTGLVGRIIEVGAHRARVLLLDDPDFRVHFRLDRRPGGGLLAGAIDCPGTLQPRFLESRLSFLAGDLLITAGGDGVFPTGIVIGAVTELAQLPEDVRVTAAVDLERLRGVVVLKPSTLVSEPR